MELDERAQRWLITLAVALVIGTLWGLSVAGRKRQQAHFAALARSLGREVVREGEFLSRFLAEMEGRTIDVRYQHIGRAVGSGGWTPGWYLVTDTVLEGVSDLHSAEIRPRGRRPKAVDPDDPEFAKYFPLRDSGYPLREGWLNPRMRSAISQFYALELSLDPLLIEEGRLIHRSHLPVRRFSADDLRQLLARQSAVAAALETSL